MEKEKECLEALLCGIPYLKLFEHLEGQQLLPEIIATFHNHREEAPVWEVAVRRALPDPPAKKQQEAVGSALAWRGRLRPPLPSPEEPEQPRCPTQEMGRASPSAANAWLLSTSGRGDTTGAPPPSALTPQCPHLTFSCHGSFRATAEGSSGSLLKDVGVWASCSERRLLQEGREMLIFLGGGILLHMEAELDYTILRFLGFL